MADLTTSETAIKESGLSTMTTAYGDSTSRSINTVLTVEQNTFSHVIDGEKGKAPNTYSDTTIRFKVPDSKPYGIEVSGAKYSRSQYIIMAAGGEEGATFKATETYVSLRGADGKILSSVRLDHVSPDALKNGTDALQIQRPDGKIEKVYSANFSQHNIGVDKDPTLREIDAKIKIGDSVQLARALAKFNETPVQPVKDVSPDAKGATR